MLEVEIRHRLGDFTLDLAFSAPGGVTALFGQSGAGKTSVVNAVAGLLRPERARIVIAGETLEDTEAGVRLPVSRRRIGYVFQEARLFPHMSVRSNLLYGARGDAGLVRVVDMLGIGGLLARRPGTLSGGERQRVAIGRALLSEPRLLLLDEPLAALDEARKAEILPYLERLRDAAGLPILYVSHSVSEIARLAGHVVVMERGRVLRSGPTMAVLADPDAAPSLGIREAGALIAARLVAHHPDGISELAFAGGALFLPLVAAAPGAALRVRIEAQDVMLSLGRPEDVSALNILPVRIVGLREGEGPGVIVLLDAGGDKLLARITRRSATAMGLAPGLDCFAVIKSVAVAAGNVASMPGGKGAP